MTDRIRAIHVTFNLTLIWRSLLVLLCVFLLTACSPSQLTPDRAVIRQAISYQIDRTQQTLVQTLKLETIPTWKIDKLSIREQQPMEIQDLPSFAIRGTYDITLNLPTQNVTRQNNPFSVYLQYREDVKNWRIARPYPSQTQDRVEWETSSLE